jgi:hypothetical protein
MTSERRVDGRNRARDIILGLIFLALGIAGLLIQAELLQDWLNRELSTPGEYYRQARDFLDDYVGWVIAGLLLLGLLLLWLGLGWIRRQFATPTTRVRDITLQEEPQGSTVVDADVVSHALERDLVRMPDIHDASVRLLAAGSRPRLAVRATVDGAANLGTVRDEMEQAYGRLRTVLGSEGIESNLHVKPVPSRRPRVV